MKIGKHIVKYRIAIIILSVLLLIPSIHNYLNIRVNYDMLTYLPSDIETVKGQDILLDEYNKGAFCFIIVDNMQPKQVSELHAKIEKVEHVDTVLWYDSIFDISIPMEMLPDKIYDEFNSDTGTIMAVFFDSSTSEECSINALKEIRKICDKECYISGMTGLVLDLKELCEKEEPIYIVIAVILSAIAMVLLLDSWIIPFIFLIGIGFAVIYNLGSNNSFGEISYITKALSAVLQLAVTMDYSIFLWHSYNEKRETIDDKFTAMAEAIDATLVSITGSSLTTIAGFAALCFMQFTLGKDMGIVMAKGVLIGVICCVTVLPSFILVFDKLLQKTKHKTLLKDTQKIAKFITKHGTVFLLVFLLAIFPAYKGYQLTNSETYYNLALCLPDDMPCAIANNKLESDFNIASTHMVLIDANTSYDDINSMIDEMEKVSGVKYVLGLEAFVGPDFPLDMIPDDVIDLLKTDDLELMIINSEYQVATDEISKQIDELNIILKKYDPNGMLIGEGPCTKDMIEITDEDFKNVNIASIAAIFVIIMLVQRSITLPFILIAVIELSIFINFSFPHIMGIQLPFIAPIIISTIQLGATVDYAILLTTRYKEEKHSGLDKVPAMHNALSVSISSILVSSVGLFAATFGISIYSDIDMIAPICTLLARGAIISAFCVVFLLPSLLLKLDGIICKTTIGMKVKNK